MSTISASQNRVLATDAATKMTKTAATITSSIRSMTLSYALTGRADDATPLAWCMARFPAK